MTERSAGLPSPQQVIELLDGQFTRAGCEIEDVAIDGRTQPPRITVVADSDHPIDLDTIAELSRSASELLDGLDIGAETYVLEVTSRGVETPLTSEKHFRRARGRRVEIELIGAQSEGKGTADDGTADAGTAGEGGSGRVVLGRIGDVDDGVVSLVVHARHDWSIRRFPLTEIRRAVVQVDFSPPKARELELINGPGHAAETEAEA